MGWFAVTLSCSSWSGIVPCGNGSLPLGFSPGSHAFGDLGTVGVPEGLRLDKLPSWADGCSVDLDPTA